MNEIPTGPDGRPLDPAIAEEFDRRLIHDRFGLSYAAYLVWPRLVLQSMPGDWQRRFGALADELEAARGEYLDGEYEVKLRDPGGKGSTPDPLADYRHGRLEG